MKNDRTLSLNPPDPTVLLPRALPDEGYTIGDEAMAFELTNVDGSQVSLSGMENAKRILCHFFLQYLSLRKSLWKTNDNNCTKSMLPRGIR